MTSQLVEVGGSWIPSTKSGYFFSGVRANKSHTLTGSEGANIGVGLASAPLSEGALDVMVKLLFLERWIDRNFERDTCRVSKHHDVQREP